MATDTAPVVFEVLHAVERRVSCTLDELVQALPDYSWNQVFMAVDSLSREGILTIRRGPQSQYLIIVAGDRKAS